MYQAFSWNVLSENDVELKVREDSMAGVKEEWLVLWEEGVRANRRSRATCRRTGRPLRREWKGGEPAVAGREGGN